MYSVTDVDLNPGFTPNCTSAISVGDCDLTWSRTLPVRSSVGSLWFLKFGIAPLYGDEGGHAGGRPDLATFLTRYEIDLPRDA